jgi:hypothetical protein
VRQRGATALSGEGGSDRVALAATVLLALATVATAWSGYQASRWGAETTKATMRGTTARLESTRASDLANAQAQVDVAVFVQWADAYASGDRQLRDFYFERFRPEFKPAVVAWIATRPLKNPKAPLTPFAMPQYRSEARRDADRLEVQADAWAATARRNVQRSTNYVLGVVLFAAALFFAGMSTKLPSPRLRVAMLAIGAVVFLGTLAWIAVSPVSVAV